MILAAGLGTRLRPLTDNMPKALVSVAGRPMLEHVILKLKAAGFTEIVINIHYLGEQIVDFLQANGFFGLKIYISDERAGIYGTGGGVKAAYKCFGDSGEPMLVHNVDILSNADLKQLYDWHLQHTDVATLLVSPRKTSRYLLLDDTDRLCGWINKATGQVRPEAAGNDLPLLREYAFSGIQVLSSSAFRWMETLGWHGNFSLMDFYIDNCRTLDFMARPDENLQLIDIGKPETLVQAEDFVRSLSGGISV